MRYSLRWPYKVLCKKLFEALLQYFNEFFLYATKILLA